MNTILNYAVNLIDRFRKLFSRVFDTVDQVLNEVTEIIDAHGPVVLEYVYTTAVKLERAIPDHGYGSTKAVILDGILQTQVIPLLEDLRRARLSDVAKDAVVEYAHKKLVEFVAERNGLDDWEQYIADLNDVEGK
ncbi:MAG: hypothetical protein WC997_02370 [Porticoccaceae bacterium]